MERENYTLFDCRSSYQQILNLKDAASGADKCTVVPAGISLQLGQPACQPASCPFKHLEHLATWSRHFLSTAPGWLTPDKLSPRQRAIFPCAIIPVHAFRSFSRPGSGFPFSLLIERTPDIFKSAAYSPDIVRTTERLHGLRRTTTHLATACRLLLRTPICQFCIVTIDSRRFTIRYSIR